MALISCPDCNAQVSDAAPACPKCSRPIKATTIEATGKKWKLVQLAGAIAVVFGLLAVMGSSGDSETATGAVFFFILGLTMVVAGRIGAWWQHG